MRYSATAASSLWLRLIALAAVLVVALALNHLWPRPARQPAAFPPAATFPLRAGPFTMTSTESPSERGRQELWSAYRGASPANLAYIAFSFGVQSFHDWIGCFLIQGPRPLWSGSLGVSGDGHAARFQAAVLDQGSDIRAVAHSECWHGAWRGSSWQDRWFALWRNPRQPVPLLNSYVVAPAGSQAATVPALRAQLQSLLTGLDWNRLNTVCRGSNPR